MAIENHEDDFDDTLDNDDQDDNSLDGDNLNHDSDPDDNGDERLVTDSDQTEEEKERESIRARRREQRKHKKEVIKAKEQVFRSELAARDQMIEQLTQRLNVIEQKGSVNDVQQIDAELNRLVAEYTTAKQYLEKGTNEQNGQLVANATERMQQIRNRAEQLAMHKQQMEQRQQMAPRVNAPDPRLQSYADRWLSENKWYDANGHDRESSTVKAIDVALANEGNWNPNTPEYWEELTERVKVALPHRFKTDYTPEKRPTSSPVSGSSKTSSGKQSASYNLSPERVAAMKEAGVWDDPKRRAAMIEAYKRYDKENKVA